MSRSNLLSPATHNRLQNKIQKQKKQIVSERTSHRMMTSTGLRSRCEN